MATQEADGVPTVPGHEVSILEILNSSSESPTLAAMTSTLPDTLPALMSAQCAAVKVVRLSSVNPRLVRNASLKVLCVVNGFVLVPIHTVMSLSEPTESRYTRFTTTGAENSNIT